MDKNAIEAVAEAWASIDGKDDHFRRERDEKVRFMDPTCTGHYAGYLAEAEELICRIERRGFTVRPIAS